MKNILLLLCSLLIINCKQENKISKTVKGAHYELTIAPETKAVLILFPCFPCDIAYTKTEATFLKDLDKKGITTLLFDMNQRLYLSDEEKKAFTKSINTVFEKYQINKDNIYIGGFSSGGNVSIVLSNYLHETKNTISPKGVFVVDSPLDIEKLYLNAKTDLKRNRSRDAVDEGRFIIELLENSLGKPEKNSSKYEEMSPYLISKNATNNIKFLKNIKTRFYYEPDLEYHLKDAGRDYKELNAYQLEQTHKALLKLGSKKSECIITKGRGYRADGSKNPHTWNLVEKEDLVRWMLN